jgi:hypothetical protein
MEGGTTFHFVTDGFESALEQARLYLHVVPITLGGGERLFDGVGDVELDPAEVVASPAVTHVRYTVRR